MQTDAHMHADRRVLIFPRLLLQGHPTRSPRGGAGIGRPLSPELHFVEKAVPHARSLARTHAHSHALTHDCSLFCTQLTTPTTS